MRTRLFALGICATAMFLLLPGLSFGQVSKPPRITTAETQALLKSDPTLLNEFKTPQNTTLKFVKPVKGGIQLQFQRASGLKGTLTLLGSKNVIYDKSWWQIAGEFISLVLDKVIGGGGATAGGGAGSGSGSGSGSGGCVNNTVNLTINLGSNSTMGNVNVDATACGSGSGGSPE
jgi:hypothetical protein